MILNSIEKVSQKQQNATQKRSRHNSTSKQPIQQPIIPLKPTNQQPTHATKQKTNQNQEFLRWIKQIYKNKSKKQELLKVGEGHADQIYQLQRNINKLQQYRDQLNKKIKLLRKQSAYDEEEIEEDIVMERTYFQQSEDRIDVSRQRSGILENDAIGEDNVYLV